MARDVTGWSELLGDDQWTRSVGIYVWLMWTHHGRWSVAEQSFGEKDFDAPARVKTLARAKRWANSVILAELRKEQKQRARQIARLEKEVG